MGFLDQRISLGGFLADREQGDLRRLDAVTRAGEHRSHLGELHEPIRTALSIGAGVEQHRGRAAGNRNRRCDGRTLHAFDSAHSKQSAGHGCSGVAGTHHR